MRKNTSDDDITVAATDKTARNMIWDNVLGEVKPYIRTIPCISLALFFYAGKWMLKRGSTHKHCTTGSSRGMQKRFEEENREYAIGVENYYSADYPPVPSKAKITRIVPLIFASCDNPTSMIDKFSDELKKKGLVEKVASGHAGRFYSELHTKDFMTIYTEFVAFCKANDCKFVFDTEKCVIGSDDSVSFGKYLLCDKKIIS